MQSPASLFWSFSYPQDGALLIHLTDHCHDGDEGGYWDSAPRDEPHHCLPGLQVHTTLAAPLKSPQVSSQYPGFRCYCVGSACLPTAQPETEGAFIPNEGSQLNFQVTDFFHFNFSLLPK